MDGFTTWEVLATYGGCAAMVGLLTQFTKGWPYLERLPTQLWSYLLSLGVLILAFLLHRAAHRGQRGPIAFQCGDRIADRKRRVCGNGPR